MHLIYYREMKKEKIEANCSPKRGNVSISMELKKKNWPRPRRNEIVSELSNNADRLM